jgi:release factor glutamine methyltransferase
LSVAEQLARGTAAVASSSSPRADALLLLAYTLRRERAWILANGEAPVLEDDARNFVGLCARRNAGEPIAYILGTAGFYGREFLVNQSVLIPRPETELLVEEALRFIAGPMRVLDVGTGCGAIACSIAAETQALVDGTDLSPAAVELATENARRLSVSDRCNFQVSDLAEVFRGKRFDVIVANLPYIPSADLPQPPDPVSFEPPEALDGGSDGLALYRRLLRELPTLLEAPSLVLLEAAPPTIGVLAEMTHTAFPRAAVSMVADYAGLARCVKAAL